MLFKPIVGSFGGRWGMVSEGHACAIPYDAQVHEGHYSPSSFS